MTGCHEPLKSTDKCICVYCLNERTKKLELEIKSLTEMYKHLSISIAGYQDHKNRQIDENRKISRRVDEILEICIRQLTDRIEKLESPDNDEPNHVLKMHERIDFILNKLKSVEKSISNWEEEFYFLQNKIRSPDSNPHKCPVCDGKGSFKKEVEPRVISFEVCISCMGKGIVWS